MRALVFDDTLRFDAHHPDPKPGPDDALLHVLRAGICATDLEIVRGYLGFRGVPGHEFVARVIEGPPPLRGRRVVAEINCVCGRCDLCTAGLSTHCRRRTVVGISGRDGAFAEMLAVPASNCRVLPDEIGDEEAVFVEPLAAAMQVLRQVKVEPSMRVAVVGTGRLGLLVAQVLARTGCALLAVGRNPLTLGRLDRGGIRTATAAEVPRRQDHDVVVECTGSAEGLPLALSLVRPRGTVIVKTTLAERPPVDLAPLVINEVTLLGSRCGPFDDAIAALARREIEVASMVSRAFSLSQGLAAFESAADPRNVKVLLKPDA